MKLGETGLRGAQPPPERVGPLAARSSPCAAARTRSGRLRGTLFASPLRCFGRKIITARLSSYLLQHEGTPARTAGQRAPGAVHHTAGSSRSAPGWERREQSPAGGGAPHAPRRPTPCWDRWGAPRAGQTPWANVPRSLLHAKATEGGGPQQRGATATECSPTPDPRTGPGHRSAHRPANPGAAGPTPASTDKQWGAEGHGARRDPAIYAGGCTSPLPRRSPQNHPSHLGGLRRASPRDPSPPRHRHPPRTASGPPGASQPRNSPRWGGDGGGLSASRGPPRIRAAPPQPSIRQPAPRGGPAPSPSDPPPAPSLLLPPKRSRREPGSRKQPSPVLPCLPRAGSKHSGE